MHIPDREGEHALQSRQAAFTPLRIGHQQHFGVAFGAERMAEAGQFIAQGAEIINRAVENEREAPIRRLHGLMAVGRIEDREPAHAERGGAVRFDAAVVRPAVQHARAHAFHRGGAQFGRGLRADKSGYATHDAW